MKNCVMFGVAVGVVVGAVFATLYKPAQNIIKKGTEAIKDEAKTMVEKASKAKV